MMLAGIILHVSFEIFGLDGYLYPWNLCLCVRWGWGGGGVGAGVYTVFTSVYLLHFGFCFLACYISSAY